MQIFKQVDLYRRKIQKNPENLRKVYAKRISSPKLLRTFSPISKIVKRSSGLCTLKTNDQKNSLEDLKESSIPLSKVGIRLGVSTFSLNREENTNSPAPSYGSGVVRVLSSSTFCETQTTVINDNLNKIPPSSFTFCECGKECGEGESLCKECLQTNGSKELAGYLYLQKNNDQLERHWLQLLNKELYCIFSHTIFYR